MEDQPDRKRYPTETKGIYCTLHICTRLAKCNCCPFIKRRNREILSSHLNEVFKCDHLPPNNYISCEISNVVYCITCNKCKDQYVGETIRKFRDRIYEHKYSVRINSANKSTPVSLHFNKRGHKISDMMFQVLEWCATK